MKNSVFLLIVLFLAATHNYAQDENDRIGFHAGWQSAKWKSGKNFVGGPLNAFYGGIFFSGGSKNGGAQLSLNYMQCGYSVKGGDTPGYRKVHYLQIPLDLKLRIGPASLLGGGYVSNLMADRFVVNGARTETASAKFFDLGVHTGLSVEAGNFGIEARRYFGFTGLLEHNDYHNRFFQLGLFYKLPQD